ncbi:hypothetical protein V8E54_000925, partial [Elaphomyces granulatus]
MVLRTRAAAWPRSPTWIDLPNEGLTPCPALLLIMRNGKTNKHHKAVWGCFAIKTSCFACCRSWVSTSFGAGILLSAAGPALRQLPSFYGPHEYYDWRTLPGEIKHPKRKWAYEGQRDWTEKRFVGAGIQSSKTHATRKQAARQEVEGVDEAQIRRAGRWSNDAISG